MDVLQALSPKLIGATYALIKGDLETARELGKESIAAEPYAKEAYLLLTYACSGLGLWVETAEFGRIAFCLGVEEKRLLALLAGLYQAVKLDREADWFINQFEVDAVDLSQALSNIDEADILDELSRVPKMPRKAQFARHDSFGGDEQNKSFLKPRFTFSKTRSTLPNWLEVSETTNLNDVYVKSPDWINEVSDSLDAVFRIPIQRVTWLEDSEQFDVEDVNDFSAVPAESVHESTSQIDNESSLISSESSFDSFNREESLLGAVEQAQILGLGKEFEVALELAELNLAQENGKSKKLFGPLIIALSGSQLMIVAYEGDMLRQKPWAFSSEQLLQVSAQERNVILTVQGNRLIAFQVETKEQADYLVKKLSNWS